MKNNTNRIEQTANYHFNNNVVRTVLGTFGNFTKSNQPPVGLGRYFGPYQTVKPLYCCDFLLTASFIDMPIMPTFVPTTATITIVVTSYGLLHAVGIDFSNDTDGVTFAYLLRDDRLVLQHVGDTSLNYNG